MIAHVAEAGEARGRVVLRFCAGAPNRTAITAAFSIAQAFQSEIESLYVEDNQLLDLAAFPFATEISLTGKERRRLSPALVHSAFQSAFVAARRQVADAARVADVPLVERFVCDEPVHALASACAQTGPWNVVAIAEAFDSMSCAKLCELFDTVSDTTAVILAGPNSQRTSGPIVVAVEDLERFPGMFRAADRLASLTEAPIVLVILSLSRSELYRMNREIRQFVADRSDVRLVPAVAISGDSAAAAETIRTIRGGFLIAHFGSIVVPRMGDLRPLVSALECPLLLVR
ncbi:MAG: hypothetical protein ACR2PG_23005 [Hyphomicrobiaceae bacterium]